MPRKSLRRAKTKALPPVAIADVSILSGQLVHALAHRRSRRAQALLQYDQTEPRVVASTDLRLLLKPL